MSKQAFIKNAITGNNAFLVKEQKFLLENLDKFTDFVKVDANEIYDYSNFNLDALRLLIEHGYEAEALKSITKINTYIREKFENFCIAVAMGEVKL
ncbi:hypothetical protein [uncultured Gemella sp.]|uniref:hypothetical protein n=1 Tax=uncultured Gemella sp. TaxID=254352 RepID=UPI0028D55204|nr:hypothetical protein [uncultured Gemella sp.]